MDNGPLDSFSTRIHKTRCGYLFSDRVWVLTPVALKLLCYEAIQTPTINEPNSIRQKGTHTLVFCFLGPTLNGSGMGFTLLGTNTWHGLLIYPQVYTTRSMCKTLHLAQTGQARLTQFLALPDSNTSQGMMISVLGQMGRRAEPVLHRRQQ